MHEKFWPQVEAATRAWAAGLNLPVIKTGEERLNIDIVIGDRDDVISVWLDSEQGPIAVEVVTGGWGCHAGYTCGLDSLTDALAQALAYSEKYGGW